MDTTYDYYLIRIFDGSFVESLADEGVIAVGWSDADMSDASSADSVLAQLDYVSDVVPTIRGKWKAQIGRFIGAKEGDRVVIPVDRGVVLAVCQGSRRYNASRYNDDLANEMEVEYLRDKDDDVLRVARDDLSEGLQRRLRVRGVTVGNLEDFRDELDRHFESAVTNREAYGWSKEIRKEEAKRAKELVQRLVENLTSGKNNLRAGGIGLERLIVELLELEGYQATIPSKRAFPDYADADVIATRADRFSEVKLLIQVKHHYGATSAWGIDQVRGVRELMAAEFVDYGLAFVTTGNLSDSVRQYAEKSDVLAIDGAELASWIYDWLPSISSRTRDALGILGIYQSL